MLDRERGVTEGFGVLKRTHRRVVESVDQVSRRSNDAATRS
jgi:hypothetical protein